MSTTVAENSAYHVTTATRVSRIGGLIMLAAVILIALAPFWADRADMRLIVEICYYLALAQMWNLLAGYAGLVSVGQQAFVGLGGYILFVYAMFLGVHPLLALVLCGLTAGLFAIPTALIVFRLRGAYFAIGTWVVAEVYRLSFANISALGGGSGTTLSLDSIRRIADSRADRDTIIFYIGIALAVFSTGLVYWLLRSRNGLALTAIRDSEPAAESMGVNNFRAKLLIYAVAATVTGFIGALIYMQKLRISPDAAFSLNDWTAYVIFIVVIGGIGRIEGPIVGTIVFFVLREFYSQYLLIDVLKWRELGPVLYWITLGVIAIVVMLRAPQGVWGLLVQRFDLQFFPVQRRLRVVRGPMTNPDGSAPPREA